MAGDAYLQPRTTGPGFKAKIAAQTSAGAGDAGRLAALDAAGKLDLSTMPTTVVGSVLRANITGSASVNVVGVAACDLTLTGNVTSFAITGWLASTAILQRVRIRVLQDGTGGRSFDWKLIAGLWAESPPDTLDTSPNATSLQFWASTSDGGTTVWLEPIGIVYTNTQSTVQATESTVPAITGGGTADVGHPYSMVTSVILVDQSTGERVEPDWKHILPTDPGSDIRITFVGTVGSNAYKVRVAGMTATPPRLTVTASEWEQVSLAITGATTIDPRIDWTGPAGAVQWLWGDGTISTPTSGSTVSKTYGSAYTGNVILRWKRGVKIIRFISNSDFWSFNVGLLADAFPNLVYIEGQGNAIVGDVSTLAPLTAMAGLFLNGNASLAGALDVAIAGMTLCNSVNLGSTKVGGTVASFSGKTAMRLVDLNGTFVTGDIATFASIPLLQVLLINNTAVSGTISALTPCTALQALQSYTTSTTGDPSLIAAAAVAQLSSLRHFTVATNPTTAQLDATITALAAGAVSNGTLNIGGTNPAITNTSGKTTLQGRGWTVTNN